MSNNQPKPFLSFGSLLRQLRERNRKSQAEVSSAVEIDQSRLVSYEMGEARPSEDILYLLIQHFGLKDNEAQELWRLAGYGTNVVDEPHYFMNNDSGDVKQIKQVSINPDDAKIVYTDMIQVMVNNYGVILNFMQGAGINDQPLAVSRIGMSKEHARSVVDVLQKTLDQADKLDAQKNNPPKQLSSGKKQQGK